jgi:hypothetical protein
MESSEAFDEWQALASELDEIREQMKSQSSKSETKNSLFDERLLAAKIAELESLRSRGRVHDLIFSLRSDLYRDFGNVTNRCAHGLGMFQPKPLLLGGLPPLLMSTLCSFASP